LLYSDISEYDFSKYNTSKEEIVLTAVQKHEYAAEGLMKNLSKISKYDNKEEIILTAVQKYKYAAAVLINYLFDISEYDNQGKLQFLSQLATNDQNIDFNFTGNQKESEKELLDIVQNSKWAAEELMKKLPGISEDDIKETIVLVAVQEYKWGAEDLIKNKWNEIKYYKNRKIIVSKCLQSFEQDDDKIDFVVDNLKNIDKNFLEAERIKYLIESKNYELNFNNDLDIFEFRAENLWDYNKKQTYHNLQNIFTEKELYTLLSNLDYGEQNLRSMDYLYNNNEITSENRYRLIDLQKKLGGFFTPQLAKQYLQCKDADAKTETVLLEKYQKLMLQVLSSDKIDDPKNLLTVEAIYLAYRPTGHTENSILRKIRNGEVRDFTEHLNRINFTKEGYDLILESIQEKLKKSLDKKTLNQTDQNIFAKGVNLSKQLDFWTDYQQSKDKKQITEVDYFLEQQKLLTGFFELSNNYRLKNYQEIMNKGDWNRDRLEELNEILKIIPKEDEFKNNIETKLQIDQDFNKQVIDLVETDISLCLKKERNKFKNEKESLKEFTAEKKALKHIINELEKDLFADINDLLDKSEIKELFSQEDLAIMKNQDREDLLDDLKDFRLKMFFDVDKTEELYTKQLICKLKKISQQVRTKVITPNLKKYVVEKTNKKIEAKALISKNIGSFFAKAGAKLCTANNTNMWSECRHYHLNIVENKQIIGNCFFIFHWLFKC